MVFSEHHAYDKDYSISTNYNEWIYTEMICNKFQQITSKATQCNKRYAGRYRAFTAKNIRLSTLSEFVELKRLKEKVHRQNSLASLFLTSQDAFFIIYKYQMCEVRGGTG